MSAPVNFDATSPCIAPPEICPNCGGALRPLAQRDPEPPSALNPSVVDVAIAQEVDVGAAPAAPSSPPESADVGQVRTCIWRGRIVWDDVPEKNDSCLDTRVGRLIDARADHVPFMKYRVP